MTFAPPSTLAPLHEGGAPALTSRTAAIGKRGAVDLFHHQEDGSWGFLARLEPQAGAQGEFGAAVALDFGLHRDTLAVGAPHSDDTRDLDVGGDNGYVNIYLIEDDGRWTLEQTVVPEMFTLTPSGNREFGFGNSVALRGDTLVVGAARFRGGYGRAFVFHRGPDGMFRQSDELHERPEAQRFDAEFGYAVAIDSGTIVVTRPDAASSREPPISGKVFVYADRTGAVPQVLESPTSSPDAYDGFGEAAALFGGQLAVRSRDTVLLFTRSATGWGFSGWSTAVGRGSHNSIALELSVLAIGEPNASGGGEIAAGAVRMFEWRGSAYVPQVVRTEPAPRRGHNVGATVALFGNEMLVGAPGDPLTDPMYSATLDYVDGPY